VLWIGHVTFQRYVSISLLRHPRTSLVNIAPRFLGRYAWPRRERTPWCLLRATCGAWCSPTTPPCSSAPTDELVAEKGYGPRKFYEAPLLIKVRCRTQAVGCRFCAQKMRIVNFDYYTNFKLFRSFATVRCSKAPIQRCVKQFG